MEADLRPVQSTLCDGATFGRKSLAELLTSTPLGQFRKLALSMAHVATASKSVTHCAKAYAKSRKVGRPSQLYTARAVS